MPPVGSNPRECVRTAGIKDDEIRTHSSAITLQDIGISLPVTRPAGTEAVSMADPVRSAPRWRGSGAMRFELRQCAPNPGSYPPLLCSGPRASFETC